MPHICIIAMHSLRMSGGDVTTGERGYANSGTKDNVIVSVTNKLAGKFNRIYNNAMADSDIQYNIF